ncbi:hypothetical protein XENOCAPTIV_008936 [Xenoophorus captivus]|uniref:Uncharacterized protein n=1 Tax=Xenoophorus captivus TaxID=1517983 RepID=A0ABV0RXV3_9TELE
MISRGSRGVPRTEPAFFISLLSFFKSLLLVHASFHSIFYEYAWIQHSVSNQLLRDDLLWLSLKGVSDCLLDFCPLSSLLYDCVGHNMTVAQHLYIKNAFFLNCCSDYVRR